MLTLSIIIPTFNEQENVKPLYTALQAQLRHVQWEAIFVDDHSQDNTVDEIMALSKLHSNIRLIRRIGRRGLSSACIEGLLSSTSPYLCIMDADMQHDERLIPKMLAELERDAETDIVVGSRYCEQASMGTLNSIRVKISQIATRLSRLFYSADLTDPMSGFFMIRASSLTKHAPNLSGIGYKILLDIVMTGKRINIVELPYDMRSRHAGESKLDIKVAYEYFLLLSEKTIGQYIPTRLLMFLLVGASGILVHLLIVGTLYKQFEMAFVGATIIATYLAMVSNFTLNNMFTYRDRKLAGRHFISGCLRFVLACSIGALVNITIADMMFERTNIWWIASLLGAVFGATWNYTMSNIFTWKDK